jgi:DNA-binding PadR family transcriptional regulator
MSLDRIEARYYIDRGYIEPRSSLYHGIRMKTRPPDPQTLLPLPVSEFQILLALADEERHGYAIRREVADRTDGDVQLGPGTLYAAIKRMVSSGFIEESDERPDPGLDDERRRYYRITSLGRRVAMAEARRMERLVGIARAKRLLGRPEPA